MKAIPQSTEQRKWLHYEFTHLGINELSSCVTIVVSVLTILSVLFTPKAKLVVLALGITALLLVLISFKEKNSLKLAMPYSPVYLKTIHNQLSAMFNHAVRFYGLPENPAAKTGNMGKEKCGEVLVWTKDEYLQFIETLKDKSASYYAFETLYWCGLRLGEMLALTPVDFDFERKIIHIKSKRQSHFRK